MQTYFTILRLDVHGGLGVGVAGWQTGFRRDADEVDSPQDLSDEEDDHPEREPLLQKVERGGGDGAAAADGGGGGELVWTAGEIIARGPHGMTAPAEEVRGARRQGPMQKLRGLCTNVVGVLSKEARTSGRFWPSGRTRP